MKLPDRRFGSPGSLKRLLIYPLLIISLFGLAIGGAVSAQQNAFSTASGVPHLKHVFVIVMENHGYSDIMYEHDVPFIHYLARTYGLATQYYGISNPSSPNRVGLLSGTTANLEEPGVSGHNLTQRSLIDQLIAHHISWGNYYQHSRFSTEANPVYDYNTKPPTGTFFRFKDIADNPALLAHFHPLRLLGQQLMSVKGAGPVPQFVWIRPNSLGNMEGGYRSPGQFTFQGAGPGGATPPDSQLEAAGNAFLATWVPRILHSRVWHQGPAAIFIAFDETSYDASNAPVGYWASDAGVAGSPVLPAGVDLSGNPAFPFPGGVDGGGHALALVITNQARHVVSAVPYNEFSILRTIEQGFGLHYLGEAGAPHVHSMAAFFHPQPESGLGAAMATPQLLTGAYPPQLGATPAVTAAPPASVASTTATITALSDPYFMEATAHQAASTLVIQEKTAGVLRRSIQIKVTSPAGVVLATRSGPVATTRVASPSDTATEFAPSTVSGGLVTIPVSQTSQVPSEVFVTGLLVDVPMGTPAGPVDVTVMSDGADLGTLAVGTVGRPATVGALPVMMAPIVTPGQVQFPFVPPASAGRHALYTLQIEGAYPMVAPARETNERFVGYTMTTGPMVSDAQAELTVLAGKEYWARIVTATGAMAAPVSFTAQGD